LSIAVNKTTLSIGSLVPGGSAKTDNLVITTTTENPTGYTTTISTNSSTETCLRRPSDSTTCATAAKTITPVSGSVSAAGVVSPSTLAPNQWGASLDPFFINPDPGDDSAWFAIPNNTAPGMIKDSAVATSTTGETQTVTIGAKADYTLPATAAGDEYRNTLVITVTANAGTLPTPTITNISPNTGYTTGNEEIIITGTGLDTAYQVFIDLDNNGDQDTGEECDNANIDSDTQIICDTPTATTVGTYDVVVKTWGGVAILADGFTYESNICRNADLYSKCVVELDVNMIPITYTGNITAPEWRKADVSLAGDWYDYENQKWANAVTVKAADGTKTLADYQTDPTGTVIEEDDILGYFVYIPRYAYQVQRFSPSDPPSCGPAATNNPGTCSTTLADGLYGPRNFNIKFQKSTDPVLIPAQTGDWATHPAFEFVTGGVTKHLNGLWVGKFETTGSSGALTIKPNQTSLRSQTVSLQYDQAKRIGAIDSVAESYGGSSYLNNAGTGAIPQNQHNLNQAKSHMLTNRDWGAAIYLATSVYGAGDQTFADGANLNDYGVVGKNANSDYITGCGRYDSHSDASSYAGGTTCSNGGTDSSYYTDHGKQASTTQNVYGIYDMVGGSYEYTMSNYDSTNGSAGFSSTAMPDGSYINKYLTINGFTGSGYYTNFNVCTFATCGGQGLYETTFVAPVSNYFQSWSRDVSYFVYSSYPWARRGGDYSNTYGAGLFDSSSNTGASYSDYGFRVGAGVF
jgi:hypothetical protein